MSEIFQSLKISCLVRKSLELGLNFSYLLQYSVNRDINQHDLRNFSPRVFYIFCKKVIKKYFFKEMLFLCLWFNRLCSSDIISAYHRVNKLFPDKYDQISYYSASEMTKIVLSQYISTTPKLNYLKYLQGIISLAINPNTNPKMGVLKMLRIIKNRSYKERFFYRLILSLL